MSDHSGVPFVPPFATSPYGFIAPLNSLQFPENIAELRFKQQPLSRRLKIYIAKIWIKPNGHGSFTKRYCRQQLYSKFGMRFDCCTGVFGRLTFRFPPGTVANLVRGQLSKGDRNPNSPLVAIQVRSVITVPHQTVYYSLSGVTVPHQTVYYSLSGVIWWSRHTPSSRRCPWEPSMYIFKCEIVYHQCLSTNVRLRHRSSSACSLTLLLMDNLVSADFFH